MIILRLGKVAEVGKIAPVVAENPAASLLGIGSDRNSYFITLGYLIS